MTAQRRVHAKPEAYRLAVARGVLRLGPATVRALRAGRIEKGDPLQVGEIAGLQAMKRTHELIPHCHAIPLTGSSVELRRTATGISAEATAEAVYRTGVEMEALVGVSVALLTAWDMVKYLEKNAAGQYPRTSMGPIQVVRKTKRALAGAR